jgi:hypothetical protein
MIWGLASTRTTRTLAAGTGNAPMDDMTELEVDADEAGKIKKVD